MSQYGDVYGDRVKAAVTAEGGRGGGDPSIAQGSVPSREAVGRAVAAVMAG